jgi:hypothetical protein
MQNYEKTLEIIRLQNEISRREFETAVNSPFGFSVTPLGGNVSEWQPLLEYPEPLPEK